LVALAFLSLIKSSDFNLAKLECIKLHQTELRFRQFGPSGQAFMACALSKSLLKAPDT
jgi:hypothetical protein